MKKEEIGQKICDVYNALNTLTLTGCDNFKIAADCMNTLKEILPEILNLNIVEEVKGEIVEKE